jgi:hypothetical protein
LHRWGSDNLPEGLSRGLDAAKGTATTRPGPAMPPAAAEDRTTRRRKIESHRIRPTRGLDGLTTGDRTQSPREVAAMVPEPTTRVPA